MTHRLALVSCVKSKRPVPAPAKDLYTVALFDGFRAYAEANADSWYILSAEHGLLHLDEDVAPCLYGLLKRVDSMANQETGCPFCDFPGSDPFRTSASASAFADANPVTDGHTLVIPNRHVASLFDLPADELADVWRLAGEVRAALAASHDADAFTIGVNDGESAGQTVVDNCTTYGGSVLRA